MGTISPEHVVGVVGAGIMGGGIAQIAAAAGHRVLLFDANAKAPPQAIQRISSALERLVAKSRIPADVRKALLGRIQPCTVITDLAEASLVIEAVVEDLGVKQGLFAELEAIVGDRTILATNTSSISVTAIGAKLEQPERLVGMHFFNPVPLMALVEVISGLSTSREVAGTIFDTALAWGKHPVHARSTPGFIVNRVARPFYAEALRVLGEGGAAPATIDAITREAGGFRMGPFELMDLIGHDVNYAVTRSVYDAYFQDPRFTPSLIQQELVVGGFLGRKSGRGFFDYAETAARPQPSTAASAPPPSRVSVSESAGILAPLLRLVRKAGITVDEHATEPCGLILEDRVALKLTDGRTATERMVTDADHPLVLVDLALDYSTASRVPLAKADQASESDLALAVGLFQALGKNVSVIDDVPGMVLMRTICMLANEGADAVHQGVCSAAAVDTAMCGGVNYPLGPLAWAERIGIDRVVRVLGNLASGYGEDRYRVSPLLRRKLHSGGTLL